MDSDGDFSDSATAALYPASAELLTCRVCAKTVMGFAQEGMEAKGLSPSRVNRHEQAINRSGSMIPNGSAK